MQGTTPLKESSPKAPLLSIETISFIILWATLAIMLIARFQLLGMPLERDEGGYAYIGQHMLGSEQLYTDMYDIKLPGLYLLYAFFHYLPGGYEKSIHLGLMIFHITALWLFFQWIKQLFTLKTAALSTAFFALSAVLPSIYGFATHATQLLLAPQIGALILLWNYQYKGKSIVALLGSGLLTGIAFTIKQPAIVFIFFGLGVLLSDRSAEWLQRIKTAFIYGFSTTIPYLIIVAYFAIQGRFSSFWFWTFTVPGAQTIQAGESWLYIKTLLPPVINEHPGLWIAGSISVLLLPFIRIGMAPQRRWITALALLSLLSSAIGLGFMPHYFIPAIPWLAVALSLVIEFFALKIKREILVIGGAGLLILLPPIWKNQDYLFRPNYQKISEKAYHWNGFSEIKAISEELKKRIKPGERIAILGSEPQLNYYTNTLHCSPHLYMYPVMRDTRLKAQFQQEFLEDFRACDATFVIVSASEASWIPQFTQTDFFKKELWGYVTQQYDLIGRANIGQYPMSIVWDDAIKTHHPPQCPPIFVFKKKR